MTSFSLFAFCTCTTLKKLNTLMANLLLMPFIVPSCLHVILTYHCTCLISMLKFILYYFFVDMAVEDKIDNLEKTLRDLSDRLKTELIKLNTSVDSVLELLTQLPIKLKMEYDAEIKTVLSELMKERSIQELMLRLRSLFSFLDYCLLDYLIQNLCSYKLKTDMRSYVRMIHEFMKDTKVGDLIKAKWPGRRLQSDDFKELWIKVKKDSMLYTLEKVDDMRKRLCANIKLSVVLSSIVSFIPASSFYVVLAIPVVLAEKVREAVYRVHPDFYKNEGIEMIIMDNKQLCFELSTTEDPSKQPRCIFAPISEGKILILSFLQTTTSYLYNLCIEVK